MNIQEIHLMTESLKTIAAAYKEYGIYPDNILDTMEYMHEKVRKAVGYTSLVNAAGDSIQKKIVFGPQEEVKQDIIKLMKTSPIKEKKIEENPSEPLVTAETSIKENPSEPLVTAETSIKEKEVQTIAASVEKPVTLSRFENAQDAAAHIRNIMKEYLKAKNITDIQRIPVDVKENWKKLILDYYPNNHSLLLKNNKGKKERSKSVLTLAYAMIQEIIKEKITSIVNSEVQATAHKKEETIVTPSTSTVTKAESKEISINKTVDQSIKEATSKLIEKANPSEKSILESLKETTLTTEQFKEKLTKGALLEYNKIKNSSENKEDRTISQMYWKQLVDIILKRAEKDAALAGEMKGCSKNKVGNYLNGIINSTYGADFYRKAI